MPSQSPTEQASIQSSETIVINKPVAIAGTRIKDTGIGRDEGSVVVGGMRSDRMLEESGRRGDPAWSLAGAEDFAEDNPQLELRRQEFEAERRAMQAITCCQNPEGPLCLPRQEAMELYCT